RLASICPLISPYDGHHGPLHSFPTRRSSDLVGRRLPWHEPGTTTETRDGAHEALAEETAHEDDHRGEHEQVAHADFTQRLGGHLHKQGAHERAGDGAHPADDHHADDEARLEDEP